MRLSPAATFASLGTGAVGATIAVVILGADGHASQPSTTYQIKQDAQTGAAVITSGAPKTTAAVKPASPVSAAPASTVVVRHSAAVQQQEAPVATDSSTADSAPTAEPAVTEPSDVKIEASYPNGVSAVPPTGNLAPVSSPALPPPGH